MGRASAKSALRVLPDESRAIRRSRSSRWRAGVLIAVHLMIALHITHWLVAGRTVTPVEPSEAMAFTKAGIVNAGLIFFAASILLTAVFGRFFCGWACHLVALQDLSRWLLEKLGRKPKPLRSRLLRWVPAVAFFYMFLWPLVYRLWAGDTFERHGSELTTSEFWATFPGWIIGAATFLICGYLIVYFLGAKGFCTYACPYGAVFAAADRLSPLRVRVTDACQGCAHCTAVCTSNVRVHQEVRDYGMVVDSGCMRCLDCVSVCPNDALYYGAGPLPLLATPRVPGPGVKTYPLKWSEEGLLAVAFIAGFFTFRGLYGQIPFLMSLGLAAVLAYLVLLTVQLATRPHLALKSFRLKRTGSLLPAGYCFLGLMGFLIALWLHSAVVRYQDFRGELGFRATAELRRQALDVTVPWTLPLGDQHATIEAARAQLASTESLGLLPTAGNSAEIAWLDFLLDPSSESAASSIALALARNERPAEMHQLRARQAWRRRDLAATAAAYEQAIAVAPSRPEAYLNLGLVLAEAGDLPGAERAFTRGRAAVGNTPELTYNLGLARAFQGDVATAIALFGEVLATQPQHLEARENLAGLLASDGRFEESVEHFRLALERSPEDARTRLLLARALVALGELEGAETELRESLRLDPGLQEAIMLLDQLAAQRSD